MPALLHLLRDPHGDVGVLGLQSAELERRHRDHRQRGRSHDCGGSVGVLRNGDLPEPVSWYRPARTLRRSVAGNGPQHTGPGVLKLSQLVAEVTTKVVPVVVLKLS